MYIDEKTFEALTSEAIDSLPKEYIDNMDNVAIVVEDEPSEEQKKKLHLCDNQLLFGLYEGIPKISRSANYSFVPPDKITIFKNPILEVSDTLDELKNQIKRTVWHEIAHHYGLDHDRIHELENKSR
jgi:predicted Zn-dependent protease with MMP-like domain